MKITFEQYLNIRRIIKYKDEYWNCMSDNEYVVSLKDLKRDYNKKYNMKKGRNR